MAIFATLNIVVIITILVMSLQVIRDGNGINTGIFVPMSDWDEIVRKHEDLKVLVDLPIKPKIKLSDLAGKLSDASAEAMGKSIAEMRDEWEERLDNLRR